MVCGYPAAMYAAGVIQVVSVAPPVTPDVFPYVGGGYYPT